jgi:hypothetical protein
VKSHAIGFFHEGMLCQAHSEGTSGFSVAAIFLCMNPHPALSIYPVPYGLYRPVF